MRGYFFCASLSLFAFLFGCSTVPKDQAGNLDDKIVDLSKTTQVLEKRIDDLSRTISLLINDGNRLHNEVSGIGGESTDLRGEIELIEGSVKKLDGYLNNLDTDNKALKEGIRQEMEEMRKAQIELSNRLEIMKLDIKGKIETAPGH